MKPARLPNHSPCSSHPCLLRSLAATVVRTARAGVGRALSLAALVLVLATHGLTAAQATEMGNPAATAEVAAVAKALAVAAAAVPGKATSPSAADEAWREAEALFARRAEGAHGAVADPAMADAAVAAYRRAWAQSPGDLVRLGGLLHALYFRGTYCGDVGETKEALFDEGRRLGQAATNALEKPLVEMPDADRLASLRRVPGTASVFYWSMANWGEWALIAGTFSAATSGVGGMMRHHATTVAALDPYLDGAGAFRALGRLHHQSPRIPFLTGWVSKTEAIEHLRHSMALDPECRTAWVYLAEAILDYEPEHREEALALLRRAVTEAPRPEYVVEDARSSDLARAILAARG